MENFHLIFGINLCINDEGNKFNCDWAYVFRQGSEDKTSSLATTDYRHTDVPYVTHYWSELL